MNEMLAKKQNQITTILSITQHSIRDNECLFQFWVKTNHTVFISLSIWPSNRIKFEVFHIKYIDGQIVIRAIRGTNVCENFFEFITRALHMLKSIHMRRCSHKYMHTHLRARNTYRSNISLCFANFTFALCHP